MISIFFIIYIGVFCCALRYIKPRREEIVVAAIVCALIIIVVDPSFAQQQPPTAQQILQNAVGNLVGQNAELSVRVEQLNRQVENTATELVKSQARIKELEQKDHNK